MLALVRAVAGFNPEDVGDVTGFRVSISVASCQLLGSGQLTKTSLVLVNGRTLPKLRERTAI